MDRKVKVRVKGLCGSNEPFSSGHFHPHPPGWNLNEWRWTLGSIFYGLEWSGSSMWLAGCCWMVRFFFLFRARRRAFIWILFSGIFVIVGSGFLLRRLLNGFYSLRPRRQLLSSESQGRLPPICRAINCSLLARYDHIPSTTRVVRLSDSFFPILVSLYR